MGRDVVEERVSLLYNLIWCGWLTRRNYDEAVRLMQRATTLPRNTKVDYYNDVSCPYFGQTQS